VKGRAGPLLYLLIGSLAACVSVEPVTTVAPAPLPPGDALPNSIDAMLYGSAQTCLADAECPGKVCYYGACIGLLVVDQRWMQMAITERVVAAVTSREALRPRVIKQLDRVLDQPEADLAFRARALLPLERLGSEASLERALQDPDERLQAAAAMGLTRLGSAKGLTLTQALTEHPLQAVAMEALRALGTSQLPEALPALLRTLNAELDPALLRAALAGLQAHGDARAMRPLTDWLDHAPEYLHHEILASMRSISGETIGYDTPAWRAWIAEHNPPPPPAYTLRVFAADDDLGLPTP
jgi:hypothetical protein